MRYIEKVIESAGQTRPNAQPLPVDVVGHALDLRASPLVSDAFGDHIATLGLDDLSAEQRHLARTRIAGSISTRFALASLRTPGVTPFINLSETSQADVVSELIKSYESTRPDYASLLLLNTSADPIASLSHTQTREIVYRSRMADLTLGDRLKLLTSYANIIPGSFPETPHTIAPIAENDATLTQAFGRDSITDKELAHIKEQREMLGDDTQMMEYLEYIGFEPGPSNDALAETINIVLTGPSPNEQMLQWEPAFSLWKNHPDTYARFKDYLHILWPSRDFYPTFEVKADSIKAMDIVGAYNPAESAHADMMIRALGIISRQGMIADPLIEAVVPFDPNSTQPHVRSAGPWVVREFLTRGEHVLRGRVKF